MSAHLDQLLFAVFPYVATVIFLLGTIYRYRAQSFTYSSLSSQLLENRHHFWGVVPFHYGILFVLAGHIVAFLVPGWILLWNARPLRLYILEVSALVGGFLALVGFLAIIARRITEERVRVVTSRLDWLLYFVLLLSIASGVYVAVFYPWGSSWFAAAATPYLWSLATLNPDIRYVAAMPFAVKLHIVNAFLILTLFPFSRLVHILVVPNHYLWRRTQVVRWNRRPAPLASRSRP